MPLCCGSGLCLPLTCLVRFKKKKEHLLPVLCVFDFDHTILNENSDTAVLASLRKPIPEELRNFYTGYNWTEYMERIMIYLAQQGITVNMIRDRVKAVKFAPGMEELLQHIRAQRLDHPGTKLVIISDANDFFIQTALRNLEPPVIPDLILSNRETGLHLTPSAEGGTQKALEYLKIEAYEFQTTCPFCPKNLCKGDALELAIKKFGPFRTVFYAGDGSNDLCPATRLSENDTLFIRKGYTLERTIGRGIFQNQRFEIRAKSIYYTHGNEIQSVMEF